jgi:hypothetical protein
VQAKKVKTEDLESDSEACYERLEFLISRLLLFLKLLTEITFFAKNVPVCKRLALSCVECHTNRSLKFLKSFHQDSSKWRPI